MELDKNLPDTVLQDEDTHAELPELACQIAQNMFTLDMPLPPVTWAVSETMLLCLCIYCLV